MKSHEVIRMACEQKGAKWVSSQLGVSQALLYKWMQPDEDLGSGARNPLDRLELLLKITQDRRILDWLCVQSNGYFIENPEYTPAGDDLHPAMSLILQEFADMLASLAKAGEDQQITEAESKQLRQQWDKMKSVCEGFVRACEQGNYDHVRKKILETDFSHLAKAS